MEKFKSEKKLHIPKVQAFYSLKRKYEQETRESKVSVISFDYMQNLLLPYIRTNTRFYARRCGIMCLVDMICRMILLQYALMMKV